MTSVYFVEDVRVQTAQLTDAADTQETEEVVIETAQITPDDSADQVKLTIPGAIVAPVTPEIPEDGVNRKMPIIMAIAAGIILMCGCLIWFILYRRRKQAQTA